MLDEPLSTIYFYLFILIIVTFIFYFYSKNKNKKKMQNICKWLIIIENIFPFIYIIFDAIYSSVTGITYISGWNDKAYGYNAFIITILGYLLYMWFMLIIHIVILVYIGNTSKKKINEE